MVETKLPDLPYGLTAGSIISAEGSAVFEPLIASGAVEQLADQRQIAGLKAGTNILAKDYLKAMRIRRQVQRELREMLIQLDAFVSPSRFGPATKLNEPLDRPSSGATLNRPAAQGRGLRDLGAAGNLAGLPALSLPCGFAENVPLGISLVSRPFTENLILAIGREFQKATDWHRRKPPGV
jgi:aspartyl-tRNA(Asn)/glutamyl-tRNA(Gln) amidotransferase subunit A